MLVFVRIVVSIVRAINSGRIMADGNSGITVTDLVMLRLNPSLSVTVRFTM